MKTTFSYFTGMFENLAPAVNTSCKLNIVLQKTQIKNIIKYQLFIHPFREFSRILPLRILLCGPYRASGPGIVGEGGQGGRKIPWDPLSPISKNWVSQKKCHTNKKINIIIIFVIIIINN